MVTPINPELRITDCVNPEDYSVKQALKAGVTTIHSMPGSGTNLAGFSVIIKTTGSSPEEMILRELGAMKATQAYNPERYSGDLGFTRMGMSWSLRQMLKRAKEYTDAWEAYNRGERKDKPEFKPEWEKVRKVFRGEIPTIVHTYEGWGGRPKMLARSGFLHVENVFSPTTQALGFAAGRNRAAYWDRLLFPAVLCAPKPPTNSAHSEFTPDVSSLAFLSGAVLYQNLSLSSTTHRKMYRTPLIHQQRPSSVLE